MMIVTQFIALIIANLYLESIICSLLSYYDVKDHTFVYAMGISLSSLFIFLTGWGGGGGGEKMKLNALRFMAFLLSLANY